MVTHTLETRNTQFYYQWIDTKRKFKFLNNTSVSYSVHKKGRGGARFVFYNKRQVKRLLKFLQAWITPQHPEDSNLQVKSLIGPYTHGQWVRMKLMGDLATSLQCKVGIAMYIWAKGGECFMQRKAKSGDGDVCCNAQCKSSVTSRKVAIH